MRTLLNQRLATRAAEAVQVLDQAGVRATSMWIHLHEDGLDSIHFQSSTGTSGHMAEADALAIAGALYVRTGGEPRRSEPREPGTLTAHYVTSPTGSVEWTVLSEPTFEQIQATDAEQAVVR